MEIKVIIDDGVIRGVLKNSDDPVHVELVDTSDCYEDHDALEAYAQRLFRDPNFVDCDYNVAELR